MFSQPCPACAKCALWPLEYAVHGTISLTNTGMPVATKSAYAGSIRTSFASTIVA